MLARDPKIAAFLYVVAVIWVFSKFFLARDPKNAAFLAAQILSLNNETLAGKLREDRIKQEKNLIEDSKKIEVLLKEKA